MKTLGNILWFILGGWIAGTVWVLMGAVCYVTIIGIPFGTACFRIASFAYCPFGKELVDARDVGERRIAMTGLGNFLWVVLFGLWNSIFFILAGIAMCCGIVTIPFGFAYFKLAAAGFAPLGKRIVSTDMARVIRERKARGELDRRTGRGGDEGSAPPGTGAPAGEEPYGEPEGEEEEGDETGGDIFLRKVRLGRKLDAAMQESLPGAERGRLEKIRDLYLAGVEAQQAGEKDAAVALYRRAEEAFAVWRKGNRGCRTAASSVPPSAWGRGTEETLPPWLPMAGVAIAMLVGFLVWKQAMPWISSIRTAGREGLSQPAQLEAGNEAEKERLAAEKAEEEKRLTEQKAAAEEAKRQEAARERELEEAVYRLAAEAKSKTEATAEYDRGQGFGERLDEAKSKLQQGEAAIQGRNFEKAKEWLEESLAAAKWLEENAPLREEAIRAGRVAVAAKKKADAMDGERLNLPSYQRGNERSAEGARAFANTRFKDATTAWTAAGKAYAAAETEVRDEKVRQGLEAARGAKWRGAWEEVIAKANEVLMLDAGNTEAQWLKKEAETKLKPILVVSAVFVGGVRPLGEPNAVLKLGSSTYTLPATIDCSSLFSIGPGPVELAKGGKAHGTFDRMKIDWKGEKRVVVELKLAEVSIDLGNGVKLDMVHCPGVAADFWMGKYEVTQEQWQQVTGKNPSHFGGKPKNPVDCVSWNDCQDFVKALNAMPSMRNNGLVFRLPTLEEWEKACRAGAPASERCCKLADGTQITTENILRVAWSVGYDGKTHPVGKKEPNAWGLYDMHGNAQEWVQAGGLGVRASGDLPHPPTWHVGGLGGRGVGFRLAASGRAATR